jgi:DNA-binding transcriptional LysR family regulator
MNIQQIRYFLALSEKRNFRRAAQRCNVAQPSVTNAIKALERELGGQLFWRKRPRIELSALGRAVLPHFARIAHEMDSMQETVRAMMADAALSPRDGDSPSDGGIVIGT